MGNSIATLYNVTKSYKYFTAIKNVSFDLKEGEVFGFIGPNGAGKTTTIKLLTGLLQSFEGKINVGGLELPGNQEKIHQLIGYLPQASGFPAWKTIDHALMSLGMLSGVSKNELEKRIPEYLKRFDLAKDRHKKIKKLSGGMKQKVGFIQALLHSPKLVILDEPLAGLDPGSRIKVKEVIRELKESGTTVMFSSHILSDVQDVADRIGILSKGELLKTGTLDELKAHFGIPRDILVEYSEMPEEIEFLEKVEGVTASKRKNSNTFSLQISKVADSDVLIDQVIRLSLDKKGKIRKIGNIAPNLDELYMQFVREHYALTKNE